MSVTTGDEVDLIISDSDRYFAMPASLAPHLCLICAAGVAFFLHREEYRRFVLSTVLPPPTGTAAAGNAAAQEEEEAVFQQEAYLVSSSPGILIGPVRFM
jgi:hypothetical protein